MRYLLLSVLLLTSLHAKLLIRPFDAIHQAYGEEVKIEKKNILLNSKKAAAITKAAQQKLKTKIYRTFKISEGDKVIAYAILTVNKMRSKDAVILFMINLEGSIESIKTVAFNEPPEFAPNSQWETLFKNKSLKDTLRVGKDIPTISGATLSARGYADGSRLALAIFDTLFKVK